MKIEKININSKFLINIYGQCDESLLFDEQYLDPENDKTPPVSGISPLASSWVVNTLPVSVTSELDAVYRVEYVYVFKSTDGDGKLKISAGTPFKWENVLDVTVKSGEWEKIDVGAECEYINFETTRTDALAEIILYGYRIGDIKRIPERTYHERPKWDKFLGTNGYVDDCDDLIQIGGYLREYHTWSQTDDHNFPDNLSYFSPMKNLYLGGDKYYSNFDFDEFYTRAKRLGVDVVPTIQSLTIKDENEKRIKILNDIGNPEDPNSYTAYARHLYQYAARYGRNKNIGEDKLKLGIGQPKRVGLDLLTTIEMGNEPNASWVDRDVYFSPFEMAAYFSAAYDGHCGTMGDGYGIKTADPTMKVSMAGIVSIGLKDIKAIAHWSKFNRPDGKMPFDIINVHHYTVKEFTKEDGTKYRAESSPEESKFDELMEDLLEWRDRYCPEKEVWLTEFGYDTSGSYKNYNSVHSYANYSCRQIQAMWIARSFFMLSATGVDRVAQYLDRDTCEEEKGDIQYSTCGYVTLPKINANGIRVGEPKESYYYAYTLKNRMKGMRFVSMNRGEKVWKYLFEDDNGKRITAVWCPSSNDTEVNNYHLKVSSQKASLIKFKFGLKVGYETELEVKNGYVTIDVSEIPVMVEEKTSQK